MNQCLAVHGNADTHVSLLKAQFTIAVGQVSGVVMTTAGHVIHQSTAALDSGSVRGDWTQAKVHENLPQTTRDNFDKYFTIYIIIIGW